MSNTMRPRPTQEGQRGGGEGADATSHDEGNQETDSEVAALSESDIFDILRNSRRRAVVSYLRQNGGRASLKTVTEHVASTEYDVDVAEVSSDQHKCVYTGLYQCHLPRLDKFDVVNFDREAKSVSLGANASEVESYLYRGDTPEIVRFELAGAGVVALLTVLGTAGVGPLSLVPVTGWTTLTGLALFAFALFHLYR